MYAASSSYKARVTSRRVMWLAQCDWPAGSSCTESSCFVLFSACLYIDFHSFVDIADKNSHHHGGDWSLVRHLRHAGNKTLQFPQHNFVSCPASCTLYCRHHPSPKPSRGFPVDENVSDREDLLLCERATLDNLLPRFSGHCREFIWENVLSVVLSVHYAVWDTALGQTLSVWD